MKMRNIIALAVSLLTWAATADAGVLEDDWLFQADGTPTVQDVENELAYSLELVSRLTKQNPGLDLSEELAGLAELEKRSIDLTSHDSGKDPISVNLMRAQWIWNTDAGHAPGNSYFHKDFTIPKGKTVKNASLIITCDDRWELYINGVEAGKSAPGSYWMSPQGIDITKHLVSGKNIFTVQGTNDGEGPAGLILAAKVLLSDGKALNLRTDSSWATTREPEAAWNAPGFSPDRNWKKADVLGYYGADPWGEFAGSASNKKSDPKVTSLYLELRAVKREIMLKNPLLDFDSILAIDNDLTHASQKGVWKHEHLFGSWEHETLHRTGQFVNGTGRLIIIDGLDPDSEVRELVPEGRGFFWRPELSYDGKKVVFCMRPKDDPAFHLYEIGTDGKNLKQLTFGDYDDLDPVYTPDGKIIFTTTRGNTYVRCLPSTPSPVLARCDGDGKNIYVISRNNEPDFLPAVMNDGRILYTRWEYTDKGLWRIQSLWSTNPDGTGTSVFWGNQSVWPDHLTEARPIPGSDKVMFCGVGHHRWFNGCVGIIDPSKGRNYPDGLYKVTQHIKWPESGDGPGDPRLPVKYHKPGNYEAYKSPYPLSEEYFLVSASRKERGGFRSSLYLMDVYGNMELLYAGKKSVMHAIPLKARPEPPVRPDMVRWPAIGEKDALVETGILYSNDVLEGTKIPKGLVKYLRIIEMDPKTYSTWLKTVQHDGPAVAPHSPESVKRILGTVPVEADGSVNFKLPAGKAVYFQLLDEQYRCVHTMRSFTGVMPGEVRGCVGCHEQRDTTPVNTIRSIAQKKGPVDITPPPWGSESIGYKRFAQPVLDQYCGKCHQGDENPKAKKKLDMTFRDGAVKFRQRAGHRKGDNVPFPEPYLTFVSGHTRWGGTNKDKVTFAGAFIHEAYGLRDPEGLRATEPMEVFSYKSRLLEYAVSGKHHKVKIDPDSQRRLTAWIDTNCPYLGEEEIRAMGEPEFEFIDTLKLRPRVKTAPEINRFNIRQDGDSKAVAEKTIKELSLKK